MAHWSVRLSDEGAPPARTPAERSSIARPLRPQDAAGGRAIPRPGGPPRTNPTHIRNATKAAGRTPASMAYPASLCEPQDAASMHKLNTATVQSARRREPIRTTGAGQGCPAPGSRRTRRRCAIVNAKPVSSAGRRGHVRLKGDGHGCPAPIAHRAMSPSDARDYRPPTTDPYPPPPGVSRTSRSPGPTSAASMDPSASMRPSARTRRWLPGAPGSPPASP